MKTPIGTLDCTPSWRAVAPIIIAGLQDGTPKGKEIAQEELEHMAQVADAAVELYVALLPFTQGTEWVTKEQHAAARAAIAKIKAAS